MFSESGINIICLSAITIRAFNLVCKNAKIFFLFILASQIIHLSDGTVAETTLQKMG